MQIESFLQQLRHRLRSAIIAEGVSRMLLLAILGFIAFGVIDNIFPLPGVIRLLVLLGYLFAVVDTVYIRLWRPLQMDMSDDQLINLIERRIPELNGRAFICQDELPLSEAEQASLQAILNDAACLRVVPAPHLKQWLASSVSVVLLTAILIVWQNGFFGIAIQRLFLPLGSAEWERSVVIAGGIAGNDVVASDKPFIFEFKRLSGSAAPLEVRWTDQDGISGHKIFEGLNDQWREVLQLGPGTYNFSFTSGDSLPVDCQGRVVERPRLAAIQATLTPPAYTGKAQATLDTLDLTVLPGTRIDYAFSFLDQAQRNITELRLMHGEAALPLSQENGQARGSLMISELTKLSLHATDQDGISMKPSPLYTIKTQVDHPPQIQLSGPRRSEKVTIEAEVALRTDARDDYGIAAAAFLMRHESSKKQAGPEAAEKNEQLTNLTTFEYPQVKSDLTERYTLRVKDYAAEQDRLVVYTEATDANDVTGPGVGTSNQIELLIVTEQVLRRELQRHIGEAREKVQQSRDALMPGMSDQDKLRQHAKQSSALAQKSDDQLADVLRRWQENKLPTGEMDAVQKAQDILADKVQPSLLKVNDTQGARKIDADLAQAYRLLSSAVSNSDLPQELAALIEQQKQLSEQSKEFVKKYMVQAMDDAAKQAQAALSDRQRELSNQVRGFEQKLQDSNDSRYKDAKDIVAKERPASRLNQASRQIASDAQRQSAIKEQEQATDAMEQMYRKMQGVSGPSMGERLGKLAQQQEQLAREMQAGEQGEKQQREQRKLEELTKRLLEELQRNQDKDKKQEAAQKHMQAAQKSQQSAQSSMKKGQGQQAQTDATVAANLLKQAQRALEDEEQKSEEEQEPQLKVLALLKEMKKDQTEVVSDAIMLHDAMGDDPKIGFRQKRQIAAIDAVEKALLVKLREKAIPVLEEQKMQIAIWGLKRLDAALVRSHEHLQTPALGERGVELCKTVLREIDRLIQIIEKLPKPNSNQESQGGGQGGQGGGSPFPPLAELNLLAQTQELILGYTMARYGDRLPAKQRELAEMINGLTQGSKEGSRARVLLERTRRAMGLATDQLQKQDLGVSTQHNQRLAVAALQQLMREAKRQQSSNSDNKNQNQQNQNSDQQQDGGSKPQQSQGSSSGGQSSAAAQAQARESLKNASAEVKAIIEQKGVDWFLKLPPKVRQSLIEVNVEELPAGARELYQRYLEILEDIDP